MLNKPEDPLDILLPLSEPKPYSFYEQKVEQRILHYYISQMIESADKYTEMFFQMQSASPADIVAVHLNTIGGDLSAGLQMINAMHSSQAHVVTTIEGEVASMGTFIFLSGDEFIVHDHSIMMIHNYTGGVFGKGHEQIAALSATTKFIKTFMTDIYGPFLTPDEIANLLKGADLYFQAPEIRKRLSRLAKQTKQTKKSAKQ